MTTAPTTVWSETTTAVASAVGTDATTGLTPEEAARRLAADGPNET